MKYVLGRRILHHRLHIQQKKHGTHSSYRWWRGTQDLNFACIAMVFILVVVFVFAPLLSGKRAENHGTPWMGPGGFTL